MPDSNSGTQITVAVIGLLGVVATAVIANWDKFKRPSPNRSGAAQESNVSPSPGKKKPVDSPPVNHNPKPASTLSNDSDAVMILEAAPPSGSHVQPGQVTHFTVTARYRLTTLEQATLSIGLVEYPEVSGCQGQGNIPVA